MHNLWLQAMLHSCTCMQLKVISRLHIGFLLLHGCTAAHACQAGLTGRSCLQTGFMLLDKLVHACISQRFSLQISFMLLDSCACTQLTVMSRLQIGFMLLHGYACT